MAPIKGIKLKTIAEEHNLNCIYKSSDYDNFKIYDLNVSRPSLQLVGFYDYFNPSRIQLMGKSEETFLSTLDEGKREEVIDALFAHRIAAMVICHRVQPDTIIVEAARKYDVNLFTTEVDTPEFMAQLINTLRTYLAPTTTEHGVLVQVHGEGLLIMGESGIGKSETALELVKRGHRLVADDSVDITRMNRTSLEGSAPPIIRYLMELRGVGIIDVRRIYGVGSVLPRCTIDLVVKFVKWDGVTAVDRLGMEDETTSFLGVDVPLITVPVAPARNLAIILEVAAMNNREKKLGHNTALEFLKAHDKLVDSGWEQIE